MKLLSFQPFSLYANGGGNRILRRLYKDKEDLVVSLAVEGSVSKLQTGAINEIIITAIPVTRRWMRWYLRDGIIWARKKVFKFWTVKRIRKVAAHIPFDIMHVVQHGSFSTALCTSSLCAGKLLWVSFHDHFLVTYTPFKEADKLWNNADRRLVISDELGREYQKLFGNRNYEIITDGVRTAEISVPIAHQAPFIIYFAGLFHLEYKPLFRVLADALDILTKQGVLLKLVLRGTQQIEFLNNRSFEIEYRPMLLDDKKLKEELDTAAILYLPIKFTNPDFYLYSLSTKMVGYLGGTGTILYHGPDNSAAYNLLHSSKAAECCITLNANDLVKHIKEAIDKGIHVSKNAKVLAQQQFNLNVIQDEFWEHNN